MRTAVVVALVAHASIGIHAGPARAADSPNPPIRIALAHGTPREQRTKAALEQLLQTYDLKKYIRTRRVTIEQGAIAHAMPVLTLNARFAFSPDELLCSFVHEQIHWHVQDRMFDQRAAVEELRRWYPGAPVGLPEGAETAISTYAHLVVCYLEIVAARDLLGPERAEAVISNKGHYTWIYAAVVRDEKRIADLVDRHHLRIK